MPKPGKNEKKSDFIKRCIPIVISEGKKQDQATAICYSIWKRSKEKKNSMTEEQLIKIITDISKTLDKMSEMLKEKRE